MKQQEQDGVTAPSGEKQHDMPASSSDAAAEAAPHWQSFYAAVREAVAAMRPDRKK